MNQRSEDSCGSHGFENGKPFFDYTCDDCMLDPRELDYDNEDNTKGVSPDTPSAQESGKGSEDGIPDIPSF